MILPALLAIFTIAVAVTAVAWPFAWDPGIFTWVGETIRHGGLPYRDAWDAKGPFSYYAYALVQGAGPRMWPVRLLDLGFLALGALGVGSIVRRFGDARTATVTALLVALTYYASDFWNTAQPDAWIACLAALAMAMLVHPESGNRPLRLSVAAFLIGMGVLQKPTFAVWLPLPLLAVWLTRRGAVGRDGARPVAMSFIAIIAAVLPAAITAMWFARQGALPALIEGYLTLNLEVSRNVVGGVPRALAWLLTRVPPVMLLGLPGLVLGGVWLWRRERRAALLLMTWAGLAWLLVAVQRRYFPYHWHPVLIASAPVAGIGFAAALRWPDRDFASPASRHLARAAVGILLVLLIMPLQVRIRDAVARLTGRMDEQTYLTQFPAHESAIIQADLALAQYLRTNTAVEDRVMVWDSPLANALAGRKSPTRIGFFFPLVTPRAGGGAFPPGPVQQRMRAEYLGGLDDPATRFVAVTADALAGREPQPRKSIPMLFPEFGERLARSWTVVDSTAGYLIFARQAP